MHPGREGGVHLHAGDAEERDSRPDAKRQEALSEGRQDALLQARYPCHLTSPAFQICTHCIFWVCLCLPVVFMYCVCVYVCVGVWEGYAQMRAEFAPQAGNHAYFLPWHRYFLRLVERELQSLSSCQLAVPYFEWTVDSGSLLSSAAWQAGLFGGDGAPGSDCVPHHPFQGRASRSRWSPCLRRSFNTSVSRFYSNLMSW